MGGSSSRSGSSSLFRSLCTPLDFETMKIAAVLALAGGVSVSLLGCGGASCPYDACMGGMQIGYVDAEGKSACELAEMNHACVTDAKACEGVDATMADLAITVSLASKDAVCAADAAA